MDDQKKIEVFERLSEILRQNGLGWVVEQVDERINEGKIEATTVQAYLETKSETGQLSIFNERQSHSMELRRTRSAERFVAIDFTPAERLQFLIDAVERAIVHTIEMEIAVTSFFRTAVSGTASQELLPPLTFYEGERFDPEPFVFSEHNLAEKKICS